ncbi:MAG TPA: NF038122 family metalloprotease [Pyrinomonadaceae bacterium]|nr:NF038122 family metalloprotease [Pyrinomonadaceae bacterium]
MRKLRRLYVIVMLVALLLTPLGSAFQNHNSVAQAQVLSAAPEKLSFITEASGSGLICRKATREEALALTKRDGVERHVITPKSHVNADGLTIILRATPQLENFPEAKDAFLAAAARWESLISTPITIVIDVDFGPTFFGEPFPPNVLGSTDTQTLMGAGIYDFVREGLVFGASSFKESQLYQRFPAGSIKTDIGQTDFMSSPSADLRALGLISPVADPVGEFPFFGPPPAIGFNSAFPLDFDPSDGIDQNELDFDGIATHEIGHALGFSSSVGLSELVPGFPPVPTVLDLFRFRPHVNLASFGGEERVLSSGGEQVFFGISPELEFSTGRLDGTGGDGFQASHWKLIVVNSHQPPIGIMVPGFALGERHVITNNDLRAFNIIGYTLR